MDQRVFDFLQGYAKENDISNKDAAHDIVDALGRLRLYDKDNRF